MDKDNEGKMILGLKLLLFLPKTNVTFFQLREHYTKLLTLCKQRQERLAEMVTFQTVSN